MMREFMAKYFDAEATPQSQLDGLISRRNEAAHMMTLENVVSTSDIKLTAQFILVLCKVIAEFLMKSASLRRREIGELVPIATITHNYSDNVVGVEINPGKIKTGDEFVAIHKQTCRIVRVLSIKSQDVAYENIEILETRELGLGLDQSVPKNTELLRDIIEPKTIPVAIAIQESLPFADGTALGETTSNDFDGERQEED
jgi:hypothetical protein